jgi:hypothetical protein
MAKPLIQSTLGMYGRHLDKSKLIGLVGGLASGSTWVELLTEPDQDATKVLPMRLPV